MLPPVLDTRNDQGCRCFVWQIEIDDGRHPVDIDAAGGNVGGDGVGRSAPRAVSTSAPKFARLFAGGSWIRTLGPGPTKREIARSSLVRPRALSQGEKK